MTECAPETVHIFERVIKLRHLFDEEGFYREVTQRPQVNQFDKLLFYASENVEHGVSQLDTSIAHFNMQVWLEVLALPVQIFAFLGDVL